MQRGNTLIKIISIILFAAMLCYVGFSLYDRYASGSGGQRKVLAVSQTVNESYAGEGLMARTERPVEGGGELCEATAADGTKVARYEAVAAVYSSADALERSRELQSLTQQRERLQTLLSYEQASQNADTSDSVVKDGILRLSREINSGVPQDLDIVCDEVRAMVISTGEESYAQRIESIDSRISQLQSGSGSVDYIYAAAAGLFSAQTDGFEALTPDSLAQMTSDELAASIERTRDAESTSSGAGKLITGLRWYFAMEVPDGYSDMISEGGSLNVRFARWLDEDVAVRVESVGELKNGMRLIVFSSDRQLAALSDVRVATAEIIFSSVTGIRVPREAARVDEDGSTYVYTLVGIQAQRKNINIIAETDDYYLVEYDRTDSGSLREGNEILVNYSGLYEGKVVG